MKSESFIHPYPPLVCKYVRFSVLLAIVALASITLAARATIIYRETFGTSTTGGQGSTLGYDWAIHNTATAVDKSASVDTIAAVNRSANASKPGSSDTIGNVNSGPIIGTTPGAYGAGIAFAATTAGPVIFWTPEYASASGTGSGIDPTVYSPLKFSWYQGCADTTGNWRVAVKVAGQWYVSQQSFLNTAGVANAANFALGGDDGNGGTSHGSELKSFTYTTNANAWFLLNFDGTFTLGGSPGTGAGANGTVLSMGAQPASNLSGPIDAFGLFSEVVGTGNRRFDTFTIDGTVGSITIAATNVWKGTVDGTTWDTGTLNWAAIDGTQTNFTQNSFSIFDDTAGNNTNINLAITVTNGGILVSNSAAHYIWSGSGNIIGLGGLTKKSNGTLILATTVPNTFAGNVDLQAGTIQLGNGNADVNAGNLGTGIITNNGVLVANMGPGGSVTLNNAIYGAGGLANIGNGTLSLGGGSGFTAGLTVSNGPVRITGSGATGTGTLRVNNNATLIMATTLNVPLVVSNGFLASFGLGTAATGPAYATNDVTFVTNTTSTIMIADPQNLTGASSSEVRITGTLRGGGDINVIGDLGHSIDPGAGFRLQGSNSVSDYSGTITVSNTAKAEIQTLIVGQSSPAGHAKIRLEGGDGSAISFAEFNLRNLSGTNITLNHDFEIIGTGYVSFNSPVATQPVTLGNLKVGNGQIVGANKNNASFTFPTVTLNGGIASFAPGTVNLGGGVASGPASLTLGTVSEIFPVSGLSMIGSSTLTLAGDATYIGPTYVSNGVMIVNGRILHSPVLVNGDGGSLGGTLGGTGVISAAVTIGDYGNLQPGVSNTVGTLTISNALSLNGDTGQGTNTMKLNRDVSPNADLIRGVTTLTEGGTLNVINVGSALQQGDTFKLYSVGSVSGGFTTVTLPPLDPPLFWNTNNLNIDGTLSVGPPLVQPTTNASITTVALSGANVLVHGTNNNVPNTSFHYVILTSTNITLPLGSWTPVVTNPFNGDGTFDYAQPIVPGTPQQFIEVKVQP